MNYLFYWTDAALTGAEIPKECWDVILLTLSVQSLSQSSLRAQHDQHIQSDGMQRFRIGPCGNQFEPVFALMPHLITLLL